MCSICKRDGHLKDECPEDFKKIELKPLPPMNDRFRDILDGLCRLCYCKSLSLYIIILLYIILEENCEKLCLQWHRAISLNVSFCLTYIQKPQRFHSR